MYVTATLAVWVAVQLSGVTSTGTPLKELLALPSSLNTGTNNTSEKAEKILIQVVFTDE